MLVEQLSDATLRNVSNPKIQQRGDLVSAETLSDCYRDDTRAGMTFGAGLRLACQRS